MDYSEKKFEVGKSTTRLLQIYIELQERNASIYNFLYESLEGVVDVIDFDDWFNDTISRKITELENCISERIHSDTFKLDAGNRVASVRGMMAILLVSRLIDCQPLWAYVGA